jgi:hypothetical protein
LDDAQQRQNLPPVVIHTLVDHGPVEVAAVGNGSSARLPCAPFEDVVHLFVTAGSATENGLLRDPRLHIVAKASDGAYTLRMSGRAHAGVLLNRHPARTALEAWAPDGVAIQRMLVVPFVAEEAEFVQGTGDSSIRHAGQTPQGMARRSMFSDTVHAAFSGMAAPLAVWSVIATVAWLGAQGAQFPGRPLALGLSVIAALGLIGGVRLLVVAQAYLHWRVGRAREVDAPILSEGLLAPIQVRGAAAVCLLTSAVALGTLATMWGSQLVMMVVGLTGIWVVGPAWLFHLMIPSPEARR